MAASVEYGIDRLFIDSGYDECDMALLAQELGDAPHYFFSLVLAQSDVEEAGT